MEKKGKRVASCCLHIKTVLSTHRHQQYTQRPSWFPREIQVLWSQTAVKQRKNKSESFKCELSEAR